MKLCLFNDCMAGDYEHSIRCCDCPEKDCPERCINEFCDNCHWAIEVNDDEKRCTEV